MCVCTCTCTCRYCIDMVIGLWCGHTFDIATLLSLSSGYNLDVYTLYMYTYMYITYMYTCTCIYDSFTSYIQYIYMYIHVRLLFFVSLTSGFNCQCSLSSLFSSPWSQIYSTLTTWQRISTRVWISHCYSLNGKRSRMFGCCKTLSKKNGQD